MTLVTWVIYAAFLVLRYEAGWRGRRAAYLAARRLPARGRSRASAPSRSRTSEHAALVLVGTSHRLAPVELRERLAFDLEDGARAGRAACRRRRRGGRPRDLQPRLPLRRHPDEARRRRELGESSSRSPGCRARARACAVRQGRRRRGAPPLPGCGRARLPRSRGGADPRAGAGGVRSRRTRAPPARSLHRLFRQALHVGKRVRSETAIGENPASVSSAAAELAARVFDDLERRSVLLVGAGKMGELAAREPDLARRRRARRRQPLAGARAASSRRAWAPRRFSSTSLEEELAEADIVIASTGSQGSCSTAETGRAGARATAAAGRSSSSTSPCRGISTRRSTISTAATSTTSTISSGSSRRASPVAGRGRAGRGDRRRRRPRTRSASGSFSRDVVPAITSLRRRAEEIRDGRARAGAGPGSRAQPERASRRRVADRPDRQQAAARADREAQGSCRRRRTAPLRGDRARALRPR